MIVVFASCFDCFLACESMFETLRTMFGLSVGGGGGGNMCFSLIFFVEFYHLSLLKLLLTVFKRFSVFMCFERKIRKFGKKIGKSLKNPKRVESFLCVVS